MAHGLVFHFRNLNYEIKAASLASHRTQLRSTIHVSREAGFAGVFELATIDLYSPRSRGWFSDLCAKRLDVDASVILDDLQSLIPHAEAQASTNKSDSDTASVTLTDREQDDATTFLKRPDLMTQILDDLEALGYAGEAINKQLGYLVATSRKLERPLSLLIESRSGAGKSALQDAVLSLMPGEECLKYSRITEQALFYKAKDGLDGKLLALEEAVGMGGAAYSIRALQSSDALTVAATGKDPVTGKMKTEEYTVQARTAVMMTTTQPDLDEETQSRFLRASIDESSEMTGRILAMQRQMDTLEGIAQKRRTERIKGVHQNAQRLLKSIAVANPYAPKLTFPSQALTARRDNRKYLNLIKAVTLLHQYQRPTQEADIDGDVFEYIEVTVQDIALANGIAQSVLTSSGQDVTPQARRLLGTVRGMLLRDGAQGKGTFTRRRLREHSGWSDWQIRTHLTELTDLEYLCIRQGKFGKEYLYELSDTCLLESLPGFGVTDIEALRVMLGGEEDDGTSNKTPTLAHLAADGGNLVANSNTLEAP